MPLLGGIGYAVPRYRTAAFSSMARQAMKLRAWWLFLVVMAPIVGLYLFGPAAFNAGPVFNAIGLTAVVAIVVGVRLHRPSDTLPWYLFAAGQALFVFGDVIAYNYERFFGRPLPFPSIADVFYLAVFPVIVAGLLLLIRRRKRGRDRASLIDSLIIATGIGLLSWVFLIAPYAHDGSLSTPARLTSMAYPLMDLLVLSVAVRLAVSGGNRGRSYYLTITSIAALFASDATYGWLQLHSSYQPGGLLDGGWIAFYLLWGAAALHPSMAVANGTAKPTQLTRTRLVMLALAAFVAPITGLLGPVTRSDRIVIAGSAIVLFGLVLLRMVELVQGQEAAGAREQALRETTDRLLHLDRLKDQFIATVSHELRTPLTSIHGYLDLLVGDEAGELSDEQRHFLSIAERNTDRLRRLVDDLLLVSELDAGKLRLELGDVDLRALAHESLESARPRAEEGGITLEFLAESPLCLTGDKMRLGQLLDNVISNALKFTPQGGRVSVRTSRSNGSAVLEVEDTGMGIPAGEQEHLFDRFFRTQAAEQDAIQGSGLGLAISQAIAQAHGGLIEVTSAENAGATFRIVFPANT
ncbi:MAG: HAMP domain-containing histidine kinase [Actinomycetota bacterium]|nr:HAMP domain-containing histidine kinase [Actinomycetota bacterium]